MPDEDDQGEEEEEEELMEKIEVEKPKFFHGPRLLLCTDDSSEQRSYSLLCYNDAHDLVFVVEGSSVLAYSGEELVTKCKDVASSSKVPVAPKCRITTPDRPKMITTNEEGTAMLCVVCAKIVLVYLVADVEKGTAKEVCSNMVGGDEISMATWKEDTLVSVYKSGRVETLDPGHGGNNNMIHENTEFAPSCATSLPRSDIALLGGKPANEEQSNLWAVDVLAGVSWQVYLEDVPTSMEDAFYYGCLCGMVVVPRKDWQAGDPYEVVCMYVLEEEGQKDAFNLQAVLSIDADGQSASVKAVTTYEIYMEEYVEQMFLHSLWIPDWTMLIMGVSAATDILVLSGEESVCQGQSWAPLGLPEGKQLNCPHSTDSNDTTKLRGLCLLTSFKGKVARKDTGTEMVAPPVVLLAASDGTVSFHYCLDPQIVASVG